VLCGTASGRVLGLVTTPMNTTSILPLPARLRRFLLALLLCGAAPLAAQAQTGSVGIGTTAPDVSAALDIVSSSKGALLPRVADATAIATPATGLLVFQTGGTPGFYYNAGTPSAPSWQQIATAADAAVTASNGLTKTGQDIALGGALSQATTIDQAGFNLNLTGLGNVGIGTPTPGQKLEVAGTTQTTNAIVTTALTGSGANLGTTVGLGVRADGGLNIGQNTSQNVFIGYQAGAANTPLGGGTGARNQFLGYQSGAANTTGRNNIYTGYRSGLVSTTGQNNIFTGYQSGLANTSGSFNVFTGSQSGVSNTIGTDNVFEGSSSGLRNTIGSSNTFSGSRSGQNNTEGSNNTFSGVDSGSNTTTGSSNTALGYNSGPASGSGTLTNTTAIGANVQLTQSNTVILGNSANVGIGTTTPGQKLEVAGGIKFTGTGSALTFPDGSTQATAGLVGGSAILNQTVRRPAATST
jgi:hypothetical protein